MASSRSAQSLGGEGQIEGGDAVAAADQGIDERAAESASGAGHDEVRHAPTVPETKNDHTGDTSVR